MALGDSPQSQSRYVRFSKFLTDHAPWLGRALARHHARLVKLSGGRLTPRFLGLELLMITTVGRRSGRERTSPLLFVRDGENFVVAASNAGNPRPPAWFLNVEASGEARVTMRGEEIPVRHRVAQGEERERLWQRLSAGYRGFSDYETWTEREIPVIVLEPRA